MPIGSTNVYNPGDLILSTVSGSGTSFTETKIAAATSSLILFNSNGTLTSASLNSTTVGTASYVSGSTSIITSITASNISASGVIIASSFTGSFSGSIGNAVNATSASYALTSSFISPSGNAFVQGGNSFGTTALLGTNDAQSLALETNGTTRMSINSNGNVGIGTTVPTGSLHIQNSVANVPILNLGGGVAFNNVSDLYVLNSYNTASGVGFAAKVIGVNISGSLTDENIPVQRTVWSGVTSATAMVLSSDDPGSGNQDNAFQIWTSNDGVAGTELTQKFSLTSPGNVGIGTTLPGEKLTVSGSSYIIGGTGAVGTGTAYYLGGSNKDISLTRVDDATLAIGRYYPSAWAETIRFTADGNVGIGTSSPAHKLQLGTLTSTSTATPETLSLGGTFSNTGGSNPKLRIWTDGAYSIGLGVSSNQLDYILGRNFHDHVFYAEGSRLMTIKGGGNVGIGIASPAAKLQVNGNVSGSSFTSSISNAVGFLGTSSFATNASTASFASNTISSSYSLTSSFATTAQTANALNTDNSYTITGLTNNSTLSQQGTLSMGSGYQLLLTTGTAPIPSLSFVGDTNTGIYSPSADTIGFSISGSELVRINSSGNVGIGTSSPLAKLDVRNQAMIGDASIGGVAYQTLSIGGHTRIHDTYRLQFGSANGGFASIGITGATTGTLTFTTWDGSAFVERLRIVNTNGNVGIGVTNPLGRLHITASATNGESLVYLSKGSGSITQYYINAVNQLGQLNYRVSSDINGHAQQTLYFAGTAHVYHDSYWSSYINNANYTQGGLGIGTSSVIHGYGLAIARPATSGSLYVSGSSVFTGSVSIRDNVGIGTTSTSDKLSVVSGSTRIASSALAGILYLGNDGNNIYLERDNNYDLSLVQNGASNGALYLTSAGSVYVNIDSNNNDTDKAFIVQNNALKAGTELFRIQENGNVGVGTSSPTAKLHIYNGSSHFEATSNGNAAIVSGLYALQIAPLHDRDSTAGSYYGGIAFNHLLNHNGVSTYNGAPQAWIGTRLQDTVGSERDYLVFATKPGTGVSGTGNDIPIERMCIDRDGLVGIGTTVPTARLHVSGSTIITGSLNVSANITCLSLTETSTEAVKYNILPLSSQLDNVLKLKPVSFNYKTNDKHSIGLIAEEVAKIYPEFTSDSNDSISYGKITSVLIQSIKELKTIIDNQQKQIEDLVNKLK